MHVLLFTKGRWTNGFEMLEESNDLSMMPAFCLAYFMFIHIFKPLMDGLLFKFSLGDQNSLYALSCLFSFFDLRARC